MVCTAILSILITLVILRFSYLVSRHGKTSVGVKKSGPSSTMIVLGSGGHTSEMFTLLSGLDLNRYTPRTYVAANNDTLSANKLSQFEGENKDICVRLIPRAREVGQSYITSVYTTIHATLSSLPGVLRTRPDLVLCNGPGTCIPVVLWAYLLKFILLSRVTVVYVESICRVERLSLSGLILYYCFMADHILVQWPALQKQYPRTRYIGRVV